MSIARFELTSDGPFAEISFDDGGMNLLSRDALVELGTILDALPAGLRVLEFRSSHESIFAAGADMQQMATFSFDDAVEFSRLGQELFARIERLPVVTVALVDGDCFGGALDLVLAFDVRVASSRSRFSHPGGKIGIVTGFGGTSRWRRVLAPSAARRLFLGNVIFSAAEAHDAGLVDEVLESFDGTETQLARKFAGRSPEEVRFVKEALRIPESLPDADFNLMASRLGALYLGSKDRN